MSGKPNEIARHLLEIATTSENATVLKEESLAEKWARETGIKDLEDKLSVPGSTVTILELHERRPTSLDILKIKKFGEQIGVGDLNNIANFPSNPSVQEAVDNDIDRNVTVPRVKLIARLRKAVSTD